MRPRVVAAWAIFTETYADGALREQREFVPGYAGSGIIMIKVTKYRCDNGVWLYEGFDYEAKIRSPFDRQPSPAPILE